MEDRRGEPDASDGDRLGRERRDSDPLSPRDARALVREAEQVAAGWRHVTVRAAAACAGQPGPAAALSGLRERLEQWCAGRSWTLSASPRHLAVAVAGPDAQAVITSVVDYVPSLPGAWRVDLLAR